MRVAARVIGNRVPSKRLSTAASNSAVGTLFRTVAIAALLLLSGCDRNPARTAAVLTDVLGFRDGGRDGTLSRFRASEAVGGVIDIREAKGFLPGRLGRGSVHHIAFRAADDLSQAAMAQKLVADLGLRPTDQLDRQYFRSVYFREPGGILFEIATDIPGFAVDEPVASLGQTLKLPAFLEPVCGAFGISRDCILERLYRDVRTLQTTLEQAPEVLKAVRMDRALGVANGVIDEGMDILSVKAGIRPVGVGVDERALDDVPLDFGL